MSKETHRNHLPTSTENYEQYSDSLTSKQRNELIAALNKSESRLWEKLDKFELSKTGEEFEYISRFTDRQNYDLFEQTDKTIHAIDEYYEKNCKIIKTGKSVDYHSLTNGVDFLNGMLSALGGEEPSHEYDSLIEKYKENIVQSIIDGGGIKSGEIQTMSDWIVEYLPRILENTGGLKENSILCIWSNQYGDYKFIPEIIESIQKTGGFKDNSAIYFSDDELSNVNEINERLKSLIDKAIKDGKHCRIYFRNNNSGRYYIENGSKVFIKDKYRNSSLENLSDEKLQREEKLGELDGSLQEAEVTKKSVESVEISDEELESGVNLVEKIHYISHFYEGVKCYDEDIKMLKSFDVNQKNEYFKNHEISSVLDFQKYILKLCLRYLEDFCEFKKKGVNVDLNDIIDAQESLKNYQNYLDLYSDNEISSSFNRISKFLEKFKQAVQKYLDFKFDFPDYFNKK